jgi:hypothetical protein
MQLSTKRLAVLVLLIAASMLVPAGTASAGDKTNGYCSPSGDFCQSVKGAQSKTSFYLGTFSFRGKIDVCVKPPNVSSECHSFKLHKSSHGIYTSTVRWSRHYDSHGKGKYRVSWYQGSDKLGQSLTFRIK